MARSDKVAGSPLALSRPRHRPGRRAPAPELGRGRARSSDV